MDAFATQQAPEDMSDGEEHAPNESLIASAAEAAFHASDNDSNDNDASANASQQQRDAMQEDAPPSNPFLDDQAADDNDDDNDDNDDDDDDDGAALDDDDAENDADAGNEDDDNDNGADASDKDAMPTDDAAAAIGNGVQAAAEDSSSDDEAQLTVNRRRKRDRTNRYELEREDLDLMAENLGFETHYDDGAPQRKRLRKRKAIEDDDDDEEDQNVDVAEKVANRLFGADDLSDNEEVEQAPLPIAAADTNYDTDEDDLNHFVVRQVDERGEAVDQPRRRTNRSSVFTGANEQQLRDALQIFGDDDDMAAYDNRGRLNDDNLETLAQSEATKAQEKMQSMFEPAVLADKQLTATDAALRHCGAPERYAEKFELHADPGLDASQASLLLQQRPAPTDSQLEHEAQWIWRPAGRLRPLFREVSSEATMLQRITRVLELIRRQLCEVPYIAQYRKEQWQPELARDHLWIIAEEDYVWFTLQQQRIKLLAHTQEVSAQARSLVDTVLAMPDESDPTVEADRTNASATMDVDATGEGATADGAAAGGETQVAASGASVGEQAEKRRMQVLNEAARADYATAHQVAELLDTTYSPNAALSLEELDDIGRYCALHQCRRETMQEAAEHAAALAVAEITQEEPEYVKHRGNLRRGFGGMELEQYRRAMRLGFGPLAAVVGLSARQLGENLHDNYLRHQPVNPEQTPDELAQEYLCDAAPIAKDALDAARVILVEEMAAEPSVRRALRQRYLPYVTVSTMPTKLGDEEITPFHEYAEIKALRDKPLRYFEGTSQFLLIMKAVDSGYLTCTMRAAGDYMKKDVLTVYLSDETDAAARAWNEFRKEVFESVLEDRLLPLMNRELKSQLLEAAQRVVAAELRVEVRQQLEAGPYKRNAANNNADDEDDLDDPERTVMALVWGSRDVPTMCAVLDRDGELKDSLKLHHMYRIKTVVVDDLTKERNTAPQDVIRESQKREDCAALARMVLTHRPIAVGVGAMAQKQESRDLATDLWDIVNELYRSESIENPIDVHYVDGAAAMEYAKSKRALNEFPDLHVIMREAIAVGRRLLDPLAEFAGLFVGGNNGDAPPIANLRWHPLQWSLPMPLLMRALETELCDVVCRVGVDLHRCLHHPHTTPLLQFVAGLGPRKATSMIAAIRRLCGGRINSRVALPDNSETRNDYDDIDFNRNLEFVCKQIGGQSIWRNCCAFLKLTQRDSDNDDVDPLDGTRVHPDDYAIARKIASDATDNSGSQHRRKLLEVCRSLLRDPRPLDEVDLGAFATELARRGVHKRAVLDDIRREFRAAFADPRRVYGPPSSRQIFFMLSGETPESLQPGVLLSVRAQMVLRTRVRVILQSGVDGVIDAQDMSDSFVEDCSALVQPKQVIEARVIDIDFELPQVRLACSSSVLSVDGRLVKEKIGALAAREQFLDTGVAFDVRTVKRRNRDREASTKKSSDDDLDVSLNRMIVHPLFKNISYRSAEEQLNYKEPGSVLFRPSSKGCDYIAMTWRFFSDPALFVHFVIHEQDKTEMTGADRLKLSKKLVLEDETYTDLNEIVARYVEPMNELARDMVQHPKFGNKTATEAGKWLNEQKEANPDGIPYIVITSQEHPGRFTMMWQPTSRRIKRDLITLTPKGYRLRGKVHATPKSLINWFKRNHDNPRTMQNRKQQRSRARSGSARGNEASSRNAAVATARDRDRRPRPPMRRPQPNYQQPSDPVMDPYAARALIPRYGAHPGAPPMQGGPPAQGGWASNAPTFGQPPMYAGARGAPPPQQPPPVNAAGGGWASGGWAQPPPRSAPRY